VHIDGRRAFSCQTQLADVAGRAVTTIEGLSANSSHPVQKAWLAERVPQCGYCQSGQIMSPHATAVYASCSALPPPHATLASRQPATALPGPDLHRLIAPALPGAFPHLITSSASASSVGGMVRPAEGKGAWEVRRCSVWRAVA
jgi:hypothetical protein